MGMLKSKTELAVGDAAKDDFDYSGAQVSVPETAEIPICLFAEDHCSDRVRIGKT